MNLPFSTDARLYRRYSSYPPDALEAVAESCAALLAAWREAHPGCAYDAERLYHFRRREIARTVLSQKEASRRGGLRELEARLEGETTQRMLRLEVTP